METRLPNAVNDGHQNNTDREDSELFSITNGSEIILPNDRELDPNKTGGTNQTQSLISHSSWDSANKTLTTTQKQNGVSEKVRSAPTGSSDEELCCWCCLECISLSCLCCPGHCCCSDADCSDCCDQCVIL